MKKVPLPILIAFGFILALFIRLLLIPNPGFEADVSFWKSWGLAVLDFGLLKGLPKTNFNYPTPFGYFLYLMVKVYSFFADPHNFNQFWLNTNLLFLTISKLPAIIADFGIAGIFLWIGNNPKRFHFPEFPFSFYGLFAIVYLLNPISIMDGAWWGQIDSIGVLLFLLSLLLLLRNKPFWAGVVYMVAMMTKLQNMIYGPVFFLLMWQVTGWSGLGRGLSGAMLTFAGTNIEYILARNFDRVMESLVGNYNYFPWFSLNAFNPWWIASGAQGMKLSDKMLVLGLANAKTVGLSLFSAGYLLSVLFMKPFTFFKKNAESIQTILYRFLTAFIIVNASFFLFQTESHDRYAFPLIIILLLWAPFFLWQHLTTRERGNVFITKRFKVMSLVYVLFSLFYFYNLHTALVLNYPNNGIPVLTILTQPALTIFVSYLFTGLFLWFLLFLASDAGVWTYILPVCFIAVALLAKNLPLLTHRPIYITAITPVAYEQDYGMREVNMPVNASLGFKSWSSLSVQYAFYRRGIGVHAKSFQTYDIGGLFKQFSFDYGIDTEAGPQASVTFEVWGDEKRLFASKSIGRYEYPRHADVDISGVHELKLVVTDADDGITDDHADWLNPKLYPI